MGYEAIGRTTLALLVAGCLSACAGDGKGLLTRLDDPKPGTRTIKILAATTRAPAGEDQPGLMYSGDRDAPGRTHFTLLTLSLPPGRKAGELPVNASRPDPQKHIALVAAEPIRGGDVPATLRKLAAARPAGERRALVFTHGFNTQFDEAVMRFAQVVDDTGYKGVPVLFSWPSRGEATAYGYDKDSANFSRDAFERTIALVSSEKSITGVDLFAHSMGNWLTMETLRGASLANNRTVTGRLGTIVMAAPDVDMDVFQTQLERLGPLKSRIVLYASSDDYALVLSRKLAGGKMRAGETTDVAAFRAMGIEAHDLSEVKGGIGRNHGKAFGDGKTVGEVGAVLASRAAETGRAADSGTVVAKTVEKGFEAVGGVVTELGRVVTGQAP